MKLQIFLVLAAVFCNGAAAWSLGGMWDWISGLWRGSGSLDPVAAEPAGATSELEATSLILSSGDQAGMKLKQLVSAPSVDVSLKAIKSAIITIKSSKALKKKYESSGKRWEDATITTEYVLAGDKEALKGRLCSLTKNKAIKSALQCEGPFGLSWTSARKMDEMKFAIMKFQLDGMRSGIITLETKMDGSGQLGATYNLTHGVVDSNEFNVADVKVDFHQAIALANYAQKRPNAKLEFNTVTLLKDTEQLNAKLRDGYRFKPKQAYYQFGHRKEYRTERGDPAPFQFVGSVDGCVNTACVEKI